jgi:DNA mismatch repair protein MutS
VGDVDAKNSPMMAQYEEVRQTLPPRTLLFFRLGDFYELFNEDAEIAARILGLTLTQRQGAPMAGVPFHAANHYLRKLLDAGWKVAVCEQLEPAVAGRLVRRALTRIYTAGTMIEDSQIEAKENHYIVAFEVDSRGVHGAWLEVSTGRLRLATSKNIGELLALLSALDPREILIREGAWDEWNNYHDCWLDAFQLLSTRRLTTELPPSYFDSDGAMEQILSTLGVHSLDSFGISPQHPAIGPTGALLIYAAKNLCGKLRNIYTIHEVRFEQSVLIDPSTAANLEIFRSVRGTRDGSLLQAIDRTVTAAGARLLREFLTQPLLSSEEITRRQNCIQELFDDETATETLRKCLSATRDLPRMLGRLQNRVRYPRELGGVLSTLEQLPAICDVISQRKMPHLQEVVRRIGDFESLRHFLKCSLADSLPQDIADGGCIRDGFNRNVDHYRKILGDAQQWLNNLEAQEQAATGIKSLRIRNTGVFGYFIEVTKANLRSVPAHYIRKQTTANGERYTTDELRAKERAISDARISALDWERRLFEEIVLQILSEAEELTEAAEALAELDVFSSWALLAREENLVRPQIADDRRIEIVQGRHPVVEQALRKNDFGANSYFVPNDCNLDSEDCQIALITGPNMGGKSTYIRQIALIVLMAQTGCWVPAKSAHIGIVDRIFSRVGAGDDLARGRSTFMVEMSETAAILHGATENSLLILDEIGRGTSTYDGLSIAWAVMEHLHGVGKAGPRTLFATHYHELTQLAKTLPRMRNFHLAVRENEDGILFLKKILPGSADRSYGLHVAKLAGLPKPVITRAQEILRNLERKGF